MADRTVDVLLVGGGVASVRCARALRRLGFEGSILLVGAEDRAPYNRPPLSKELLRDDLPEDLLAAEPPTWYARRAIELRTGTTVAALDADRHIATLSEGEVIGFERCLLATGAELRSLPIAGAEAALMLRTVSDARRIRAAALAAPPGAEVVVIGGGLIGLEVASALAALGLRPTVVEVATRVWGGSLGTRLAAWAEDRLSAAGVRLRLGSAVTTLDGGAAWIGAERLRAAFVVAGIGVRPRDGLARESGIATDDGVPVAADQRTSHPAVWAAGDVASVSGRRVEHWHAAREAGERAARSMMSLPVADPPASWLFSEIAGAALDVIGAVDPWDAEEWIEEGRILAYLDAQQVVGLASIDGALPVEVGRALVAARASMEEVVAAANVTRPS